MTGSRIAYSDVVANTAGDWFYQTRLEFHTQTQTELLELVLDLVERFLPEVAILEHLTLGLLR